jgi:hypothetical protein
MMMKGLAFQWELVGRDEDETRVCMRVHLGYLVTPRLRECGLVYC